MSRRIRNEVTSVQKTYEPRLRGKPYLVPDPFFVSPYLCRAGDIFSLGLLWV